MEENQIYRSSGEQAAAEENFYPDFSSVQTVQKPHVPHVQQAILEQAVQEHNAIQPQTQQKKADTEIIKKTGLVSFFYAIFFTFCLYKNGSGITYPFYVAGTVCFCIYTIRKSGISWKGEHILLLVAGLLLGISTCLTDNGVIVLLNKAWLLVLLLTFFLKTCFQTKGWQLMKFLEAMLGMLGESIGNMFSFFPDIKAWMEERKNTKNTQVFYCMIGVGISLPLIAAVLMLLSSADLVFRKNIETLFENLKVWDIFCCILWTVAIFLFSYGMIALLFKKGLNEAVKDRRTGQPMIAVSATAIIAVIYVYFCAIQIIYLFAGNGTLPEGYTYAQYARQGFFQLLFVCLLNLGLVLAGLGFFRENRLLKSILLVISFCTFVMIASSFYRMVLYISVYHLTFLRIFVLWALVIIALLMAGVIGKTLKNNFPLFQYGIVVITCCYLILSFARPDYWIARYNMAHMEAEYSDTWYLNGLSADAAPAIMTKKHMQQFKTYVTSDQKEDAPWYYDYVMKQKKQAEKMTLRSYNFSRGYVKKASDRYLAP